MGALENQIALVSGGASGLGLAIVERFVEEGARVAVLDKSVDRLDELAERLPDSVTVIAGDVCSLDDNQRAVRICLEAYDRLDCAIGNAGIWDYGTALVDIPACSLETGFDELFHVNVLGYLNMAKAALSALVSSRGSLIYTLSNAAFHPAGGGVLYTATKHAVVGVVKQLAHELAPHVRVNGVAPGAIPTSLKGPESLGLEDAKFPVDMFRDMVPKLLPIGVLPECHDYAGAYVFFACRRDHIPVTGTILNNDGGYSAIGLVSGRGGDDLPDRLNVEKDRDP